jgi:hypothetical protein
MSAGSGGRDFTGLQLQDQVRGKNKRAVDARSRDAIVEALAAGLPDEDRPAERQATLDSITRWVRQLSHSTAGV